MNSPTALDIRRGFSLPEAVVTIALIGILAAIIVPIYSDVRETSQRKVVEDHVEALNRAVADFSHVCWKLPTAADNGVTTDEFVVLRSLQWKFPPSSLKLGSPYFDPKYDPAPSSDTATYRIRWNGRSFEMIPRGEAGPGLRYRGVSDYKSSPYSFPDDFAPAGT
jgi:prepilin-type N-terminal cleavage/methylation domain-containing protein